MNGLKMLSITKAKAAAKAKAEAPTPKSKSKPSLLKDLLFLFIRIAVIVFVVTLLLTFIYGLHRNSDPDMTPMVKDGDVVMFYRLDKDYAIGDLLVLSFQGERQVRRVVARAGDTVDFIEAGLVINGALQQERGIFQETHRYDNGVEFPLTLGEGQMFVLGDARYNATDSRVYGAVDAADTLGKVITVMRWRHF